MVEEEACVEAVRGCVALIPSVSSCLCIAVTSMGPATALEFSVKLVEVLYGAAKSKEVASALLVPQ